MEAIICCYAIGISMGRAIAALIVYELRAAAGESSGGNGLRLAHRAEQQTAEEARLIARRRDLDATAERLGRLETYGASGTRRRALRPAE